MAGRFAFKGLVLVAGLNESVLHEKHLDAVSKLRICSESCRELFCAFYVVLSRFLARLGAWGLDDRLRFKMPTGQSLCGG